MRKNIIALIVLGIIGLVFVLTFRKEENPASQQIEAVFKPVDTNSVDTLRIRAKAKDPSAKAEDIVLSKQGGMWRMTAPVTYKIIDANVQSMLDALGELRLVDVIATEASSHANLSVDDENGVVVEVKGGGKSLAHLIIGKAQNGFNFVRLPAGNEVYRTQGYLRSIFDRTEAQLRDKTIHEATFETLKEVTFTIAGSALTLKFEGEGDARKIVAVGEPIQHFNDTKAMGVLQSLASLNAVDFADAAGSDEAFGFSATGDRVTLTFQKNGADETVTLYLGKVGPDASRTYVKTEKNKQVFLIGTSLADRMRLKASDLARTDEDMKKEAEQAKQAPAMPSAMNGQPGMNEISPEIMRQIQEKMAQMN